MIATVLISTVWSLLSGKRLLLRFEDFRKICLLVEKFAEEVAEDPGG